MVRYTFTPVRMAIIKKSTDKCWRGCGEKGTLLYYWWESKSVTATVENNMELPLKSKNKKKKIKKKI